MLIVPKDANLSIFLRKVRDDSEPRSRCTHTHNNDDSDAMVCASFNLQNINVPVPPKWKHNRHILQEYKKFHRSCQRILDGLMAHVASGKVKANMSLIWCGPDGEGICNNFELTQDKMYDVDYVMEQFELYCEPLCNFCAARYKFHQVTQRENEMTNAFYHCIQKLCTMPVQ